MGTVFFYLKFMEDLEKCKSLVTDYDKLKLRHRVLVIPKGYIRDLKSRCDRDEMTIIPLQIIIIPAIHDESFVNHNLTPFLRDFSAFINGLVPGGITVQSIKLVQKTKTDKIWDDIRKGMPSGLVALVNNTSLNHVYKVKSERRKGIKRILYRY